MIEVELPDGSIAEFPDGTPHQVMERAIQERFPAPVGMGEDIARSGATGIRQGVEGTLGMFGDAAKMTGDALGWAAGKFGFGEGGQDVARTIGRRVNPFGFAPTTDEIQEHMTKPVVGEHYQPQTVAGEYARTIGQFAPAAVAGPGTLARRTAMAVVPALASETAGQATKDTALEPYARFAGGMAGGLAAMGRPNAQTVRNAARGAPTREDLRNETNALYTHLRGAGITYDPRAYGRTVNQAQAQLRAAGFRPVGRIREAFEWVDTMAEDVARGVAPDFDDINSLRQQIGEAARTARRAPDGGPLGAALDIVVNNLDDFERAAPLVGGTNIPRQQINQIRDTARQTALRNIRARVLEDLVTNADTYAAGQEAGLRNGIRNLLRSRRGQQLFHGEERRALLAVASGRKPLQTLSRFGFDLTSVGGNATFLPTIGALGAGGALGVPFGAALAGAGTIAKVASPMLTNRAFEQASAAIRGGGLNTPQAAQQLRALTNERNLRALIAAGNSANSARLTSR